MSLRLRLTLILGSAFILLWSLARPGCSATCAGR